MRTIQKLMQQLNRKSQLNTNERTVSQSIIPDRILLFMVIKN